MKLLFMLISIMVVTSNALAEAGWGLRSYAGAGYANLNVSNSSTTLDMNGGFFIYLGVEKTLTDNGLSLTGMFNYTRANGDAQYRYTSAGTTFTSNGDIDADWNTYQLSLGLRQRFYPWPWFRPYIEGGGLYGFHQLSYGDTDNITPSPGAKTKENFTGSGFYGEAGVDIDIADGFGTRLGVRYQNSTTEAVETLDNQKLKFNAIMLQFALMLSI